MEESSLVQGSLKQYYWWFNGSGLFATIVVLFLIIICQSAKSIVVNRWRRRSVDHSRPIPVANTTTASGTISDLISDTDLKCLINDLDDNNNENWVDVVDKRNNQVSYNVKSCKPKDGPLKYLSVTVFENCSTEMLRSFYMDNDYRRQWDKTVIEHQRLEVDEISGVEIGRTIKKFPLLTPREYICAWQTWEGKDKTFYCLNKECEHASAPRLKKYVRVAFFRSGWRIRKIPGRNACEIKLLHQEDAGLNIEMAKLAFSKGIWSYVCKMDSALRMHSPTPSLSATLMKKVPFDLESATETTVSAVENRSTSSTSINNKQSTRSKFCKKPSKKFVTNGLILVGGILCLSRGHSSLSAKLAMACIMKKLTDHGTATGQAGSSGMTR